MADVIRMNTMLTKTDIETTVYKYRDGWYVDIVKDDDGLGVWLYREEYGIKSYMFGIPEKMTDEQFLQLVENNIDGYIPGYIEDVIMPDEIELSDYDQKLYEEYLADQEYDE